jgi:DNA primase small subunit
MSEAKRQKRSSPLPSEREEDQTTTTTKKKLDGGDKETTTIAVEEGKKVEEKIDVHELMRPYYATLFPSKSIFKWLCYGNDGKHAACDKTYASNREFCFTLRGDIFVRYNSYNDESSLKRDLKSKVPGKIDIGPVFSHNPKNRLAYGANFKPTERELVFDIDMTDYDDVRTCCDAAKICPKCWPLMNCAVKVLDEGLREDFGFEHILWVYSGRRGIHAWVCDERARKLSDEERSAVAEYFSVFKGIEGGGEKKKTNLSFGSGKAAKMHPRLEEAYWKVLKPFWEKEFLPAQKLMESKKHFETILSMIPDANVRNKAEFDFNNNKKPTPSRDGDVDINTWRWRRIEKAVEDELRGNKNMNWDLTRCLQTIIFSHVYPRLDAEVSKHMNHLLKAPFCVHPKTGRVCVPIDPANCDAFDPFSSDAPKVQDLLQEYKKFGADEDAVKKTAMGKALETFDRCFWSKLKVANEEMLARRTREANEEKKNVLNDSNANHAAPMEI